MAGGVPGDPGWRPGDFPVEGMEQPGGMDGLPDRAPRGSRPTGSRH
jgi:hypothetical protein